MSGERTFSSASRKNHPSLQRKTTIPPETHQAQTNQQQTMLDLQRLVGNQAVANMVESGQVVQRDLPPLNVPGLKPGDLSSVIGDSQIVNDWLNKHKGDLLLVNSVYTLVSRIRQEVPDSSKFSTNELVDLIRQYVQRHGMAVNFPLTDAAQQAKQSNPAELENAAKSGLSLSASTQIGQDKGTLTVSMSGLTAELKNKVGTESNSINVSPGGLNYEAKEGGTKVSTGVSWGGDMYFKVDQGKYHFNSSINADKWTMSLQIGDDPLPDMSALSEIFRKGEAAAIRAVGGVARAKQASDLQSAVTDNLDGVKTAISTASSIQEAAKGHFGAKVEVFGPVSNDPAKPQATGVTFNLTFVF